jgi:hypothetical protein
VLWPLRWCEIEVKRLGDCCQSVERRVWALCREEPANRLRLHLRSPGEFGLADVECFTSIVERADDAVDLVDPLPRPVICISIQRVDKARLQIPFGASGLRHEHQDTVTLLLRLGCVPVVGIADSSGLSCSLGGRLVVCRPGGHADNRARG